MEEPRARLYYLSDIHLELKKDRVAETINVIPEPHAGKNYLALCGDIGCPFEPNYAAFLARHAERFDFVFVVAGNHEYYTSKKKQHTIEETDAQAKWVTDQLPNVGYLQQSTIGVDGFIFAGCTLWSDVHPLADTIMTDYSRIYVGGGVEEPRLQWVQRGSRRKRVYLRSGKRPLSTADVQQLHYDMRGWLTDTIVASPPEGNKMVVLTHHAPSFQMLQPLTPSLAANPREMLTRPCYASECEELFVPPVVCWVSGHTHRCVDDVRINGIPSVANCFGYDGEKTGVVMAKFIEI